MPKYQHTSVLRDLREQAGLTQSQVGKHFDSDRKTVGAWERGDSAPHATKRAEFFDYLFFTLQLRYRPQELQRIWDVVVVSQWQWEELSKREQYLLSVAELSLSAAPSVSILPKELVSNQIVGREQLLHSLREKLFTSQWVALTGVPGVGKTAVAVALAQDKELQTFLPAGVLWAHVGPNPDIAGNLLSWGVELGVDVSRLSSVDLMADALRRKIGRRRYLIVIDDAWSLDDANLLAIGGPNCCQLLVTRIQNVATEFATHANTFLVPELEHADAVALLRARCPRAYSTNPQKAEELVRTVGGLPLALNVLAGYLSGGGQTVFQKDIDNRIQELSDPERRLDLAIRRLGATGKRRNTVREILLLSLEDVPTSVKQTFFQLGAFASKPATFGEEAARLVADCQTSDLTILIDRNLVELDNDESLAVHPVLSDLARTRLSADSVIRHRNYYLWCVVGQDVDDWQIIQWNYSQIRWAWQQAIKKRPGDISVFQFLTDLEPFQTRTAKWEDYAEWRAQGILVARRLDLPERVFQIILEYTIFLEAAGEYKMAFEHIDFALKLALKLKDQHVLTMALIASGRMNQIAGDNFTAIDMFEAAHRLASSLVKQTPLYHASRCLGMLYAEMGRTAEAYRYLDQALKLAQDAGTNTCLAMVLSHLAHIQFLQGNLVAAETTLGDALEVAKQTGDLGDIAAILGQLAQIQLSRGEVQTAKSYLERSINFFQAAQITSGEARSQMQLGHIHLMAGQVDDALTTFEKVYTLAKNSGKFRLQVDAAFHLGQGYWQLDSYDRAHTWLTEALRGFDTLGDKSAYAMTLSTIGNVLLDMERYVEGQANILTALEIVEEQGTPLHLPEALYRAGLAASANSNAVDAVNYYRRAVDAASRMSKPELFLASLRSLSQEYYRREEKKEAFACLVQGRQRAVDLGFTSILDGIDNETAYLQELIDKE